MKCGRVSKITTFVMIAAMILSLFAGCKKDSETIIEPDNMTYVKVTNVYKIKEFNLPDDFYYCSYFAGRDNYIYIYGFLDSEYVTLDSNEFEVKTNYAQLKYDSEGELLEIVSLNETTEVIGGYTFACLQSNGNYVLMGYNIVHLVSADGKILNKFDYATDFSRDLFVSETDEIYMLDGRILYVFDRDLHPIAEIESTDTLEKIMSDETGNIIVKSYTSNNVYFRYDVTTKTLINYNEITLDQNSKLILGLDYKPYIIDDKGIYTDETQLLSWENSDISYTRTRNHVIINEGTILCEIKDYFDTFHKPVILQLVPEDEIVEKVIIELAIMGFDNVGIINEAIELFNRDNDTYRIMTIDYTTYNKAPYYDQGLTKFNQDILKGKQPDIVMIHFSMFNAIDSYIEKNIFTDLTDVVNNSKHKLLKCVETSYCSGDKIYHIPIFMELNTIVTNSSVIDENEPFTLEKLYSLAENMKDNEALFSKYVDILNTAVYDFINYANKTCTFESDEFIKLLEFQKNIGNYINKEKGAINNFSSRYFLTSNNLYNSLANDELYFLQLPFNKLAGYLVSKMCYGDDEFTICGYPTSTGNASILRTEYTFGITEQSKVKKGAWEFIEFLLSETIQSSETLTSYGFPVTVAGIETLIDTYAEYYFDIDETDSINSNDLSGEVSIIDRGVKTILPDNHMNKEFIEYVATVSDKDRQKLLDFFNSTDVKSYTDDTVTDIVEEEFDAYEAGAITAAEAAKRIQNRIFIYLNE